jgi:hypothetical protein
MKIQMYMHLDKEKLGIGNIRSLSLAAVKPALTDVSIYIRI